MFRNLGRNFREAFFGITRHFAMAVSSASAVSITLILIGVVMLVSANITNITGNIERNVEILVKIDNTAMEVSMEYLEKQIKATEHVVEVRYSSKDAELERFIESYGDNYAVYRGANNPLRNAYYVRVDNGDLLEEVANKIKQFQYVEDTNYGGVNTVTMVKTMNSINSGGFIASLAFSLLAVFLINNTIKITIHGRSQEISIMRHVGATNGYIRRPFVIEGIFIGILGSIFPILLVIFGYRFLYIEMNGYLFTSLLALAPTVPLVFKISGILLGIGVIVGLLGSYFSVTRYLHYKR